MVVLVSEKNNQQNTKQNKKQIYSHEKIRKSDSAEILREHDNSSLTSLLSQIKSDKKKKK